MLFILCLLPLLAVGGQWQQGGVREFSTGCTPPAFTSDWAMWNTTNYCDTGGTGCPTNNQVLNDVTDSISANTAAYGSSTNGPVYSLGQINGLGAASFAGYPNAPALTFTSSIAASKTVTYWAVLNMATNSYAGGGFGLSTGGVIVGPTSNNGLAWYISTNKIWMNADYITGGPATTAVVLSAGVWYTVALQYNPSTGAYAFFTCAGGTCTNVGSGTDLITLSQPTTRIGAGSGPAVYEFFTGSIAEVGYYNGTSIAGLGAYSLCEYGI